MKQSYIFEYQNENDFRKKERSVRKYTMLSYRTLTFEYYPKMRNGEFLGTLISEDENVKNYELVIPTDDMFVKVHGELVLHYSVYEEQKIIRLTNITPDSILEEGHRAEEERHRAELEKLPKRILFEEDKLFELGLIPKRTDNGGEIIKLTLFNLIQK